MTPIATYVFLDLETTGLPSEELNKTRITEISMVAVKRNHILDTLPGASPRVQHKLTLCINPRKYINPGCEEVTGLHNFLLEYEPEFNIKVFNLVNTFLDVLEKPVCLVAQNGHRFDFPILKAHVEKLKVNLMEDLLCADSYYAFMDIDQARIINCALKKTNREVSNQTSTEIDTVDNHQPLKAQEVDKTLGQSTLSMQQQNETTPKRKIKTVQQDPIKNGLRVGMKVRKKFPFTDGTKPMVSYKLKNVYERLLNRPGLSAHRAENDCIMAMECCVSLSKEFTNWANVNSMLFSDVKPMTIGVPLGD